MHRYQNRHAKNPRKVVPTKTTLFACLSHVLDHKDSPAKRCTLAYERFESVSNIRFNMLTFLSLHVYGETSRTVSHSI